MASPHVAGALALLASVNKPTTAAGVYSLYTQVITAGNFDWTDDSGDGIKEPLLDVTTFMPKLIATGTTNTPPVVTIASPANGASFTSDASISFVGSATDAESRDLTESLTWTSSIDGPIGTGGTFSKVLNAGTHTITAEVTDSGGLIGSDSITITVADSQAVITLSVTTRKVKTNKYADLTWSGATSANVDVYRNGSIVATTPNDGAYTDKPSKTATSVTYKVCEAGTSTCSKEVAVTW
jgi:hypothetical protein